jgi:S1-C subfamily serine protease
MIRAAATLALTTLIVGLEALGSAGEVVLAEADRAVLDRVVPAAVQIAITGTATENGSTSETFIPVASGTVISADGFILTNAHAVDMAGYRAELTLLEQQAAERGEAFSFALNAKRFLILGSDGRTPVQPRFLAMVVAQDPERDLAVLLVTTDADGAPLDWSTLNLPWIPLGDSDSVRFAEPIDLLGYPAAGGDALTYTAGVVSGFGFDEGSGERAWINTDATISGGSSGGTAVNRAGELIGVVTQGSELDCRPGDTNRDGVLTADDVGCMPVGGSIGQLRPVNLATAVLEQAGYSRPLNVLGDPDCDDVVGDPAGGNVLDVPPGGNPEDDSPLPASSLTHICWVGQVADNPAPPATDDSTEQMPQVGGQTVEMAVADAILDLAIAAEASCVTGAVYDVGTRLISGSHGETGMLRLPMGNEALIVPPDTILRTVAPYMEIGICDLWPVEVVQVPLLPDPVYLDGTEVSSDLFVDVGTQGLIDERWVRPQSAQGSSGVPQCITSESENAPGLLVLHPLMPPTCPQ